MTAAILGLPAGLFALVAILIYAALIEGIGAALKWARRRNERLEAEDALDLRLARHWAGRDTVDSAHGPLPKRHRSGGGTPPHPGA